MCHKENDLDRLNVHGFKIDDFENYDRIKKWNIYRNKTDKQTSYQIETSDNKRKINLYFSYG